MKSLSLFSLLVLSCSLAPAYAAGPDCAALQAPNQKTDEDSVKRAERTWLVAEFRGDVDTVGCMLEPNYTEMRFDGGVGTRRISLKARPRQGQHYAHPHGHLDRHRGEREFSDGLQRPGHARHGWQAGEGLLHRHLHLPRRCLAPLFLGERRRRGWAEDQKLILS